MGWGRSGRRWRIAAFALALGLPLTACGGAASSTPPVRASSLPPAASPSAPRPSTSPLSPSPSPARTPRTLPADPGRLPQTRTLPSPSSWQFRARMADLWRGIVRNSLTAAMPAFFPRSAYLRLKAIGDPGADFDYRLVADFRLDLAAAHDLLGTGARHARLVSVSVPREWTWIPPGACENAFGYWHAPGSRLVYRENGVVRSFGIFSFISWHGQWFVIHLAVNGDAGTVDAPALGRGSFGPPGGC